MLLSKLCLLLSQISASTYYRSQTEFHDIPPGPTFLGPAEVSAKGPHPLKTFQLVILYSSIPLNTHPTPSDEESEEIKFIPLENRVECSDYYKKSDVDSESVLVTVSHFFNKTIYHQFCRNSVPKIQGIIFVSQHLERQILRLESVASLVKNIFFKEKMKIIVIYSNGDVYGVRVLGC